MMAMRDDIPSSIRQLLLIGLAGVAFLFVGVGGWAATTSIAGAVIAAGSLVVDSNVKKIQHPAGGVVGWLHVRDGDTVREGDLLLRLDDTITRTNVAILSNALDEFRARQARLEAERDEAEAIDFPGGLWARQADPVVARILTGEQRLFEFRGASRAGQKAQLRERIGQLQEQARAIEEQIVAKHGEIRLIGTELGGVRELWRQNLIQLSRLTSLERDEVRLRGERGALASAVAQVKGRITETELQILQIDQDLRTEVGKELQEIRAKIMEFAEKRVAAEDQLRRVDIRSPQDGRVHQLAVYTLGGVVNPGEAIMLIVPEDRLIVEVKVSPGEIDRIRVGHPVVLRFPAFNQRTTPELNGHVSRVSADVSQDQKTGLSFYTVRIAVPDEEHARLKGLVLVAGMPVEAFMQTEERTVLSFLLKPLSDQIARAWREP